MSSLSSSKIPSKSSLSSSISKTKFIWRFPPSKFDNLPSCTSKQLSSFDIQPINIDDELIQRQELSILIYDLGSHLNVSFTCIYTGVVYMHRFFMLHPFQQCRKESVAAACLFLACKVNEMPRPLNEFTRYLIEFIRNNSEESSSTAIVGNMTNEILSNSNQQIIDYENMLLSTLGFCLHVEQPFMIITRTSQTLSIPMDITQKAYEIATKSIFFTLFSMKYTTNLIACFALYLAITSSQINILDNDDGSQWFHLLNEEFTEKLLKELADEYQLICVNKCSKKIQQRFEQLRQQKTVPCQQAQSKTNGDHHHYHPIATTSDSVRSTTSSSSSIQQSSNFYEHGSIEIHHHTPNRSSSINISHDDYSPTIHFQSSSPKQNPNNFNGQYHPNNSSMSLAKPIPTLMTSSNSISSRYHSRFSAPVFKYPSSSPTQRIYRPPPPQQHPPLHPQQFHHQYPSNYVVTSSYYPQQQAPLFYHSQQDPTNLNNKRFGEPPAPPTKRFRYNINTHQHY